MGEDLSLGRLAVEFTAKTTGFFPARQALLDLLAKPAAAAGEQST